MEAKQLINYADQLTVVLQQNAKQNRVAPSDLLKGLAIATQLLRVTYPRPGQLLEIQMEAEATLAAFALSSGSN